jgi:hypothetical protein
MSVNKPADMLNKCLMHKALSLRFALNVLVLVF